MNTLELVITLGRPTGPQARHGTKCLETLSTYALSCILCCVCDG